MQSSSQIVTTNKPTPSLLQAGCSSCHPIHCVKALKETFKSDDIAWLGFSSSSSSSSSRTFI